ncbi:MAG: transcription-repair coupling factor [Chloroflexota bacterium]
MAKRLTFEEVLRILMRLDFVTKLSSELESDKKEIRIKRLEGSLKGATISAAWHIRNRRILIVVPDLERVEEWQHDVSLFVKDAQVAALAKPQTYVRFQETDVEEHYGWLVEGLTALLSSDCSIGIITPDIFDLKIPPPGEVIRHKLKVSRGDRRDFEEFTQNLLLNGFNRKDFVSQPGELAIRGGLVDVFPLGWNNPARIEFWGDEIESIREFDALSQRSVREFDDIEFIANIFHESTTEYSSCVFDYISPDTVFVMENAEKLELSEDSLKRLEEFRRVRINDFGPADITVKSEPQPKFSGSVKELAKALQEYAYQGSRILLFAEGKIHLERLRELVTGSLEAPPEEVTETSRGMAPPEETLEAIRWLEEAPSGGFLMPDMRIACLTEHQIFERRRARAENRSQKKTEGMTLSELKELRIGDFVVHEDKGVGRFDGFQAVKMGGIKQDCIRIVFAEGDMLYVQTNYIHKVQKYQASEGVEPRLTKLGSAEWQRKKAKTKKRLKDIARDLIRLYAKRKAEEGTAFPADTIWQKEFEASFIYEDTPDQARTTEEVKRDMESDSPMDRLVCGDVGFGKTEIALRAAFKAAQYGKQTAVLVPTTILAQQHYMTFRDRFGKYPVNVEVISRFRTKAQQGEILARLKKGSVDVIIGTHRLLSKDVEFKELGLLIIDEEHRFGVSAKEKIRQLRASIDTLTLTATPIPRTLNFSLMGARDLSVMETPPRNRLPVYTEILEWNNEKIAFAIRREIERGGQVFFVNDRIDDLEKIKSDLEMLMPTFKFGIAHGQMPPAMLEGVMEKFVQRKYDVLIATKIVESGIDIPNANTILINRAQNFGLAELYQLRGRVGRNNIQAYCFLLIPPVSKLNEISLRRLQAIEEFTELGSGFKLAMRDMEIRGAGNLLGAEQSGFIIDIGFELFQKILDESVQELKLEEFADIFGKKEDKLRFKNDDISIELSTDAYFPTDYIKSDTDRFFYYKALYRAENTAELNSIVDEIKDKFGRLPDQARELIFAVRMRIATLDTGFTRIALRNGKLIAEFPPETDESYYQNAFVHVADYIGSLQGAKLTQTRNKLLLEAKLDSREDALDLLWKVKKTIKATVLDE